MRTSEVIQKACFVSFMDSSLMFVRATHTQVKSCEAHGSASHSWPVQVLVPFYRDAVPLGLSTHTHTHTHNLSIYVYK